MTFDTDFSAAVYGALNGNATRLAALLRDGSYALGASERELIAQLAERCAELASGDIGGDVGRREIAAGNWRVVAVVEQFQKLIDDGKQRTQAKGIVAADHDISVRTVETYLRITKEREALSDAARNQIMKNCAA